MTRPATGTLFRRAGAAAAVLAVMQLAGCGFHLAGERTLPAELHDVYVEFVDPYHVAEPPLQTALRDRLRRVGARVEGHANPDTAVLRLSRLTEVPEVLSLGADGKAIEYRLITQVDYELIVAGEIRVGPDQQRVYSDYSFNIQEILPKEEETQQLRGFSQDQLAELVLLRVEAGLRRPRLKDHPVSAPASAQTPASPAPAPGTISPSATPTLPTPGRSRGEP